MDRTFVVCRWPWSHSVLSTASSSSLIDWSLDIELDLICIQERSRLNLRLGYNRLAALTNVKMCKVFCSLPKIFIVYSSEPWITVITFLQNHIPFYLLFSFTTCPPFAGRRAVEGLCSWHCPAIITAWIINSACVNIQRSAEVFGCRHWRLAKT